MCMICRLYGAKPLTDQPRRLREANLLASYLLTRGDDAAHISDALARLLGETYEADPEADRDWEVSNRVG